MKFLLRTLTWSLLSALNGVSTYAGTETPFVADYEVFIDGKPRMETRISFLLQGDGWTMTSESRGTRGLARILGASSRETSSGVLLGQHYQPHAYSHHSTIAGRDDRWSAQFDWENQWISTSHEDGTSRLPLSGPVTDPLALTMVIRENLLQGLQQFGLDVVDADEIDHHQYRTGASEEFSTPLGCLRTVPVERIRENSKRYSTGWYAETLHFIPVRIVHGKRGGKEFEMKIRHLELNGEAISGASDCAL